MKTEKFRFCISNIYKKDFTPHFLSKWFTRFYKDKPWNEYLVCPTCNPGYGSKATFGFKEVMKKNLKVCPNCGSRLTLFWNPQRAFNYFRYAYSRKSFIGIKAIDDLKKIIGWMWGYEVNPKILINKDLGKTFYIDVICILPRYRKLPIISSIYLSLLEKIEKRHFSFILTRTHPKAKEVTNLLKTGGFEETNIFSKENPERNFWIKSLQWVDYNIEYSHIYTSESFGDPQKKSVIILKNLIKNLKKKKKKYTLSILIDDYNPSSHILDIKHFLYQLRKFKAFPDYVMLESKLATLKDLLLKNIIDPQIRKEYFTYFQKKNKLPCSFLISIWYLTRLGRLPINSSLFFQANTKKPFEAKYLINILPRKYRDTSEKRSQKIIKASIFEKAIRKIKYIYY